MATHRLMCSLQLRYFLISLIFFSACSANYDGGDFTFTAPPGFKTDVFETPHMDSTLNQELLLFSQKGPLYFQVFRRIIAPGSDLDTILTEYKANISGITTNYQFISQDPIEFNDLPAIEYIHRVFWGEPYVQRREIWMEYNGWVYSLVCTDPVVSTPGAVIPISDQCIQLAEGFQFK